MTQSSFGHVTPHRPSPAPEGHQQLQCRTAAPEATVGGLQATHGMPLLTTPWPLARHSADFFSSAKYHKYTKTLLFGKVCTNMFSYLKWRYVYLLRLVLLEGISNGTRITIQLTWLVFLPPFRARKRKGTVESQVCFPQTSTENETTWSKIRICQCSWSTTKKRGFGALYPQLKDGNPVLHVIIRHVPSNHRLLQHTHHVQYVDLLLI